MKFAKLAPAVLAFALAAPLAWAQASPPAAAQPAANPVDPASIQALKDMGAYLQSLDRFHVRNTLTGERVLADGQKLQHFASATVDAARPNKLRAKIASARAQRELIYDGKQFTIYVPAKKYYSSVEFSESIGALAGKLEERYGVELPMADLFTWGTAAAPFDKIESAMRAGQDVIGNDLCDHYAFRQGKIDWQIWIRNGNQPIPRKLVITNRADEERPQSVSLMEWNLKPSFTDASFRFTPPKGATRIELVPVKAR